MPLQYYLAENLLTADPNDYAAKPANIRSFTLDEIIDRMTRRGATVTKSDMLAVLQTFHEEVAALVADGNAVNTPLFNAQPSIAGVFNSPNEAFTSAKHKIQLNLTSGLLLREAVAQVSVEKVPPPAATHFITAVIDKTTNATNSQLTPNAPLEIVGTKIKLSAEPDAGVFFIATDGTAHKAAMVILNQPKSLLVMTPALPAGTYSLEVRTYFSKAGSPLKTLRTTRFDKPLSVA